MATLTAKEIKAKADEWARAIRFIGPELRKAEKLQKEITAWLKTNGKSVRIEGEFAIATFTIGEKFADRVVDVHEFLEAANDKGDAEAAFECLVVEVSKAEALLGKDKVNEISTRATVETKKASLVLKEINV